MGCCEAGFGCVDVVFGCFSLGLIVYWRFRVGEFVWWALFRCTLVGWLLFHGWILWFWVGVCLLVVDFVGWVWVGWFGMVLVGVLVVVVCIVCLLQWVGVGCFLCVIYWFLGRHMFVGLVCVFVLFSIVFGFTFAVYDCLVLSVVDGGLGVVRSGL